MTISGKIFFVCRVIFYAFICHLLTFFPKFTFSKSSLRNTIRVSNILVADQDRHFVSPDLGPKCLQRLSADDKSIAGMTELKEIRKQFAGLVSHDNLR